MAREIRRLDVIFKDPSATYRAGENVTGTVTLDLSSEFKVKGVRLVLYGIARVGWDENKSYTKGTSSKTSHKNVDVYLDETLILISRTETLKGRQNWPFSVHLPAYIPGTFEGQYGRVQYWTKIQIERPWKGNIEHTKTFTVLGTLDLNVDPEAKSMVGICCKSGPIIGQLYVERRGFVAAQNIPFTAKIENNSKKKVNVRVVLSQQAIFRAEGQCRKQMILLKGITQGDVDPGEEMESVGEIQNIPPLVPSHLGAGCKNIDLKYLLTLVAVAGGPGKDLEVPVEITIGTKPLRRVEGTSASPKLKVKAAAKKESESPVARKPCKRPIVRKM
ncbi:hypothetical protein LSH36_107g05121 [Paralvinella palmiformis]|uniref:Arrestin C-terminal-like domain-containing protein n=1 Tax=Paralvinella palmiformis TaxID=53620 RepID=A0AAD9JZ67_9ANNE|nr:hypothetical protein LSH36_107g05121 [Paralvinella palmiformis]